MRREILQEDSSLEGGFELRQSWQSPAALITQLHSRETALVAHYWAMRSGGYGLSERHACRHGTHETSLCEHSKARLEDLDALRAKYVGCDRLAKDQVRKAGERRRGGRMSMTWRRLEAETCRSSNAKRLSRDVTCLRQTCDTVQTQMKYQIYVLEGHTRQALTAL